jgi:methyl-accepting chemotaxis protein
VISAAVNEQASGLQQVSSAVVQMDRVTQENASMVQRTTDAARLLTEESDALANLAARFHVGDATEVRRPAAA